MSCEKYLKIYSAVYSRPRLKTFLSALYWVATVTVVGGYGWYIGYNFIRDFLLSVYLLVVTAVPFVAVSIMRKVINAPRPYEVFDCDELDTLREYARRGTSFPSRHVASAFIISSALTFVIPLLGIIILCLGVLIAVLRVLLGRHFIRDVIVGAVIGGIAGTVGMLLVNWLFR